MKAHSATHQHEKSSSIFEFLPGPIKIKDGLFLGDEIAARDIQFVISNKVTHIINTVAKQVPNLWERFGIHYLSVNWSQKEQNIFDKKNNAINTIFHFVEEAMEQGESCLIHSINGKSRACAVLVGYLMKKYTWSLDKCLEFITNKKQNLEIRNNYLIQLQQLQQRMCQIYNLTSQWGYTKNQQELVLRNTFTNSKSLALERVPHSNLTQSQVEMEKKIKKKVSWTQKPIIMGSQDGKVGAAGKASGRVAGKDKDKEKGMVIKSILKGDPGPQMQPTKPLDPEQFEHIPSKPPNKNFINNINGNIVHVTVNNFITSQTKQPILSQTQSSQPQTISTVPVQTAQTPNSNSITNTNANSTTTKFQPNTRPYSSDQKDRQRERQRQRQRQRDKKFGGTKKPLQYDHFDYKSPYNFSSASTTKSRIGTGISNTGQVGSSSQNRSIKNSEKQKQKNAYQRPQSAKGRSSLGFNSGIGQCGSGGQVGNQTGGGSRFKDQFLVTNGMSSAAMGSSAYKSKYSGIGTVVGSGVRR